MIRAGERERETDQVTRVGEKKEISINNNNKLRFEICVYLWTSSNL
jgi:hypothetical protein